MSINGNKTGEEFYTNGKKYWNKVEPTLDGMLGGFTTITSVDIKASDRFLSKYFESLEKKNEFLNAKSKDKEVATKTTRALDCGAGIGRVTKHLLMKYFDVVDLLEQNQNFLSESKTYLGTNLFKRVGKQYNCGLQEWTPDPEVKYDCIWCQWVTGHLTDEDFVQFLLRCRTALKENGIIVIKDNTTSSDECDADTTDSSVTRPNWLLLEIFRKADLTVICDRKQYKMPKGLYPVKMFALK